jgi:endoglucanase
MRRISLCLGTMWFGSVFIFTACSSAPEQAARTTAGTSTSGNGGAASSSPASASAATATTGAGGMSATANTASSSNATSGSGGSTAPPQPLSPYIVVDQFGYPTLAEKIAVIRNPQTGFDAGSFTPGAMYALVDLQSNAKVLEAAPKAWKNGATDTSSGDQAFWFDFSSVTTPGAYFVLDEAGGIRSPIFHIADDIYNDVLKQSVRMLYYQRDGIAKDAQYAGATWADGMAHPQDAQCGLYTDGSGPKDLHGGWFDAGDQNRYTNWAASDVIQLLRAYAEKPTVFSDDYGIPESGNGVPDLLDEVKWEIDWIARMQNDDGSLLSIVGHTGASPPSTDTSACQYGPVSTSATLTSAAAFAYASMVFKASSAATAAYPGYADILATRATNAWTWADANPSVTFANSGKVGAGEQEVDDPTRVQKKVQAAAFLFELTGSATYQTFFDANYKTVLSSFDPFHMEQLDTALEYTKTAKATATVTQDILKTYQSNVTGNNYFGQMTGNTDPYFAYLQAYTWGSNQVKAGQGNMFYDLIAFNAAAANTADAARYAERYVHYLHGVNPLQLVYLSNMPTAEKSVTRFYHTWFAKGSTWDAIGVSQFGPPPGYLVGGPNPSYAWDSCCPAGCGSADNNLLCGTESPAPPTGQPNQKSYKDFNDAWPLDSWQISEPDDGYQAKYVRLLSKFVK